MENIYFLTPLFKFIEREKTDDNDLLETNENSVDPNDSQISQCGKNSFTKLRTYKTPSIYDWNNIHVEVYDNSFQRN